MNMDREAAVTLAEGMAAQMWGRFTKNEKAMVRFGMFPAEKMAEAEAQLAAAGVERDRTRLLAVALMDCAKQDGGMRA